MEKKFKTDGAMKYIFLSTFAILVLLSVVAWRIQPENTATGKIPLVCVSDDNPARLEQALKFLLYLANRECHELINHQADVLAPVNKYSYTQKYLHDPAFPEEDFNAVWRDAMNDAVPDEISPFVNGQAVQRILNKQLHLVKINQKSAADALRAPARQINEEIQKTIQRDPELRRRYEALVKGKR